MTSAVFDYKAIRERREELSIPLDTDGRRPGNSRLVYNKKLRTIEREEKVLPLSFHDTLKVLIDQLLEEVFSDIPNIEFRFRE